MGTERGNFLGTEFHIPKPRQSKIVTKKIQGRKIKARINHARVYFEAPIQKIYDILKKEGFIKEDKKTPGAIPK